MAWLGLTGILFGLWLQCCCFFMGHSFSQCMIIFFVVTSWIRLLHFAITCLLEMSAFVVTLGEFVTAVSKRILLNKFTATLSICSEAPGIEGFFSYLFEHIERHTSLVLLVFC